MLPPTPKPPEITAAPVVVLVELVVDRTVNNSVDNNAAPVKLPPVPVVIMLPPTYKFPPIPAPPVTCNAPVFVEVEVAVPVILITVDANNAAPTKLPPEPVDAIVPPTFKFPPIPTPPVTTNAPVVVLTDWVDEVTDNTEVAVTTPATLIHAPLTLL